MPNPKHYFRVVVQSLVQHPAIAPDGSSVQSVRFGIAEVGTTRVTILDGGCVGGETLARCRKLASLGSTVVAVDEDPPDVGSHAWQVRIVDAALLKVLEA